MFNSKAIIQLKSLLAEGSNSLIFQIEKVKEETNKSINVLISNNELDFESLVAKVSNKNNLTELEILKKARLDSLSYISLIEGHSEIMLNNSCFLMQKAKNDLKLIERPINEQADSCLKKFFENVLEFLSKLNIVYCDWKPSNILDFGNNHFKLTDFGSCLQKNHRVTHPNNIKPLYCSPYFMNLYDGMQITPKTRDDVIGIAYVYLWLKNVILPWAYYEPKKENNSFTRVTMLIFSSKVDENLHRFNFEKIQIPLKYKTALIEIYNDFKLNDSNKIYV
jgi:serine/threonine protein kinase